MNEIPGVFTGISRARGQQFDEDRISVVLVDGAARNVFSPESHAKGFQGLDILLLVYAKFSSEEDQDALREALESQFRDKWVARARIFDVDSAMWKVGRWTSDSSVEWPGK